MSVPAVRPTTEITLAEQVADELHNARYAGAIIDALRRARKANPEINSALLVQVEALIRAADLYEAGVEAGEFAKPGDNQWSSESRTTTQADLGINKQRISEGRRLRDKNALAHIRENIDEALALGALLRLKLGKDGFGSVSDEWHTPSEILDPTRVVLDAIDLDPASSKDANELVCATTYWTAEDEPLERDWLGRVFLNPPFSRSADFVTKLLEQFELGHTSSAVLVINGNRFDARWFHKLWDHILCFTYDRPPFRNPLMDYNARPMGGTAIVYLGSRERLFAEQFASLGAVVHRYA